MIMGIVDLQEKSIPCWFLRLVRQQTPWCLVGDANATVYEFTIPEIMENYCRFDNSIMVFKILYILEVNTKEIHDEVI